MAAVQICSFFEISEVVTAAENSRLNLDSLFQMACLTIDALPACCILIPWCTRKIVVLLLNGETTTVLLSAYTEKM